MWRHPRSESIPYVQDLLRMVSVVINTQNKVLFKLTQAFFFKCSSYTPLETVSVLLYELLLITTIRLAALFIDSGIRISTVYPHMTR